MRKILIFGICVLVLLCFPSIPVAERVEDAIIIIPEHSTLSQQSPVIITSDAEMLSAGFDGAGTAEDPYRIYSLYIPTDGTYGIWVSNVAYYFRIWDCTVTGSPHLGIGIQDCDNANVSESTVQGAEYGISIVDTPTAFVEDCHVTSAYEGVGMRFDGVLLASVSGCTITGGTTGSTVVSSTVIFDNNTISECTDGIIGEPITNCMILSNTFEDCSSYAIRFEDTSAFCSVIGNTFSGFYTGGILLRYTHDMAIVANNFTHCGLTVIGSSLSHYEHTIEGNYVNDKPLLYLSNANDAQYSGDDYGQIFLINCDNIAINGGFITSTQRGVYLAYSNDCIISDMLITACQCGITFDNAELNIISNSTIRSCSIGLLLLSNSNNNEFVGNQISYSFNKGVLFNPSTQDNFLVNNSFHHNDDGLLDNGVQNFWDDGEEFGNFYDDYIGYGNYTIPGTANSVDHFPGRYVPTSSGGLDFPVEVTLVVGAGISIAGVIIVLIFLKRIWSSEGF